MLRPLASDPMDVFDSLVIVALYVPVVLHDLIPELDILFDTSFSDEVVSCPRPHCDLPQH